MKDSTKSTVFEVLREFAVSQFPKLNKWTLDDIRQGYPFHQIFFPEKEILAARIERSVVTSMGTQLYPSLAKSIAEDRFKEVFIEHRIEGLLNDAAINMIEQIVTELRTRETPRRPNHNSELQDILNSRGGGQATRSVTADLYINDFEHGPLFIELKSPLPNLDIAAESKRKLLYYLAIMSRQRVSQAKAFLGLTYNPYVTRDKYRHSFTKRIMDMDKQVLMGDELWDYLGGSGTYAELLTIIGQVRQVLTHEIKGGFATGE